MERDIRKNLIFEECIDYLKDKEKIKGIKDVDVKVNVENGLAYYFLIVVSIVCILGTSYCVIRKKSNL